VVHFGDVPTWLAAIGTVAAFAVAFVQIRTERQSRHQKDRADLAERHVAHATLVAAIRGPEESDQQGDGRTAVDCINSSREPVYNVVATIVFIQGAAPHTTEEMLEVRLGQDPPQSIPVATLGVLPPGVWRAWAAGIGWTGVMAGRPGVEIAFTDRSGNHWIRRANGSLDELDVSPLTSLARLGYPPPYDFQTPEPLDGGYP